jgi:hypothetical protein
MPPAEIQTAPVESKQPLVQAARRAPLPPVVTAQAVTLTSSPSGATATLDGNPEITCTTPCSLDAPPGRHGVAITLPGYQVEHREVDIGSSAVELPPVVLRAPGGTLMLTSVPAGASITVNGRKRPEVTPAQITLDPGTYNITVEKDGKQNTQMVDVRNGKLNYLKIVLGQ